MPNEISETVVEKQADPVVVISRAAFNYVLIAITFLLVGMLIGVFGLKAAGDDRRLMDEDQLRETLISILEDSSIQLGSARGAPDRLAMVDDDPYLGDEDAPVVIVEFSDFFCSYCKRHFDQTFAPLLENYGEHIRYVYRDFARLTPESTPAAAAAQCAFEQGKFWEFHQTFFSNQNSLNRDFYIQTAELHGLDVPEYTACLDENRYLNEVEFDGLDGQLAGVRGTPAFFINGQLLSGAQPYSIFERLVQRELELAESS